MNKPRLSFVVGTANLRLSFVVGTANLRLHMTCCGRHINKTVFIMLQYLDGTKHFLRAVNIYRSALEHSDTEEPAACQGFGDVVVIKQLKLDEFLTDFTHSGLYQ